MWLVGKGDPVSRDKVKAGDSRGFEGATRQMSTRLLLRKQLGFVTDSLARWKY